MLPITTSTLFQLSVQIKKQPALFTLTDTMLPIADLLAYFLTNVATTDAASASITQLYNITEKTWDTTLCRQFSIPEIILPEIVPCASCKGILTPAVCQELSIPSAKVLSVCGKDTQCATLAVPANPDQPFLFLQCGISTLFGTELQESYSNGTGSFIWFFQSNWLQWYCNISKTHCWTVFNSGNQEILSRTGRNL